MAKISKEVYEKYVIYLGQGKADDIVREVKEGWRTPEEAEEFINDIIESKERSRHRRDIEPEEWRDFEDGWRPDED